MASLVWFRNDLRTQDQVSLKAACDAEGSVIGVYFFDPRFYKESDFNLNVDIELPFSRTGKYRAQFIIESVEDLRRQLDEINIPLLVFHDKPAAVIPSLIEKHDIKNIYLQKEWTRDEIEQEEELGQALEEKGLKDQVKGHRFYDQFLYHPDDIPFDSFDKIPKVFTELRKKLEKESSVRDLIEIDNYSQEAIDVENTDLPTLEDLGLETFEKDERTAFPWKGGSKTAWNRLQHYFWKTEQLKSYKKTRNGLVGTDYSSKFSAWLAVGSISPREIYHEVKKFEKEIKKNQDTYWLVFELIWRDFFKYVSLKHREKIFDIGGILQKDYDWKANDKELKKWMQGETHENFVNANMKEIAATGFMSNRGRQNVASYWSMHREQDWRIGAAYFEHILIDYDVHSNYGNWMYNSGVGNDPRNRTFNIQSQADRYDGDHEYRDLWLSE
ncbi:DASH family cryptochrome [Nonlabens ponticola]|uniref:Cryptochrome DASH n=1 Tax=Nonlabens ponticola TaxID=2496866 RepID=A0A3S9MXG9_9FLAO|nr:DASH family cryptochrome [Nonlabens ponticola]AZQ43837.1 DASH family cryptochrome [Nonlabens ponticola]